MEFTPAPKAPIAATSARIYAIWGSISRHTGALGGILPFFLFILHFFLGYDVTFTHIHLHVGIIRRNGGGARHIQIVARDQRVLSQIRATGLKNTPHVFFHGL